MIIRADARRIPLLAASVQCVVTSPPYWALRDYGVAGQLGLEATPDAYVGGLVAVFREIWRVLRPDGVVWLNLGDSYATGAGRVGTRPGGGAQGDGWAGPMTSPNRLPIEGLKPKDLVGIPWRVAFALQADGWYLRADVIWSKPNPMPESVTDRPTKSHEYVFLLTKAERYYWDADAVREIGAGRLDCGRMTSPARLNQGGEWTRQTKDESDGRNARSVWSIATQPYPGSHFATMPEKLAERCILAGSRPGDVVLDPFGGSGTTLRVARRLQRRGVSLDLNAAYLALAVARAARVQIELFAGAAPEGVSVIGN